MSSEPERDELRQEIQRHLSDGQLPCIAAHAIAQLLALPPSRVREAADQQEVRISQCQLGMFGYGPKSEGRSKLVRTAVRVPPDLRAALDDRSKDGRIPCVVCWQVASEMGVERLVVSEVAEAMGLRLVNCQLGCF